MVERVPPEAEAKYTKYVKLRDTLAAVSQERVNIESAIAEIEDVLEKLGRISGDTDMYKMVGHVLVKTTKDDVVKELSDRKEELEIRLKAVKSQEEYLKKELERLAEELKRLLGGLGGGAAPGA